MQCPQPGYTQEVLATPKDLESPCYTWPEHAVSFDSMHPIPSKISHRSLWGAIAFCRKCIRVTDGCGNGSMDTDYDNLMGATFYRKRSRKRIRNRTKGDAALSSISIVYAFAEGIPFLLVEHCNICPQEDPRSSLQIRDNGLPGTAAICCARSNNYDVGLLLTVFDGLRLREKESLFC